MEPRELSAYILIDPKYYEKYGTCKLACVNELDNIGHKRFLTIQGKDGQICSQQIC